MAPVALAEAAVASAVDDRLSAETDEPRTPAASVPRPALPLARGPLSAALFAWLRSGPDVVPLDGLELPLSVWMDDDAQLALHCCYELHYRGFAEVPEDAEWDLAVLGLRARLEERFLDEVIAAVGTDLPTTPTAVEGWLLEVASSTDGPSLSGRMAERGTLAQLREFCLHRSAYQLKEADPHTWGIPRLYGEAKAAMVEIQADEYGDGVRADMHAVLFADTLRGLGLDPTYGAALDRLPATTLATGNLVSLFGLHRRWRGALVGHLALFEMTSIGPMSRYAAAFDRLGIDPRARRFYDIHVEADVVHERIALERMVRGLLADDAGLARDVALGAAALSVVERRFAEALLTAWDEGRSSLRTPPEPAPA